MGDRRRAVALRSSCDPSVTVFACRAAVYDTNPAYSRAPLLELLSSAAHSLSLSVLCVYFSSAYAA